jgi:hypothetical protein
MRVGDLPDPDTFLAPGASQRSKLDRAPPEVIEWLERTLTRWAEKLEAGDPCGGSWSAILRWVVECYPPSACQARPGRHHEKPRAGLH